MANPTSVPPNCQPQNLDCPNSWKPGITQGSESSAPMIDQNFLFCHEGFTSCGYVLVNPKSGEVLDRVALRLALVLISEASRERHSQQYQALSLINLNLTLV